MVVEKENAGPMWKMLRKAIDLADSTPLLIRVYVGCIQRDAEVDHRAVQAEADLFRRNTTTEVTSEKQNQQQIPRKQSPRAATT